MISRTQLASAPLLPLAVCFSFGIALQSLTGGVWWAALSLLLASVLLLFFNRHLSVLALVALLGYVDAIFFVANGPDESLAGHRFVFRGEVLEAKEGASSRVNIVRLEAAGPDKQGLAPIRRCNARVVIPGFTPQMAIGDKMVFVARLEPVVYRSDLPQEITDGELCARKNVFLTAQITDADVISTSSASGLLGWSLRQRENIIRIIGTSDLSTDAKELLMAVTTGTDGVLSDDVRAGFNRSGLSHLLALSGLHVGIIAMIVSLALWPLYISGRGRLRDVAVIAALWLFVLLTGAAPSVVRATVMVTIYLVGRLMRRRVSPLNSLAAAALIILLFSPGALFTIGFQLSFAAVLAIILFAERLNPFSRRRRVLHAAASYVTVTITAVAGTGLLSAIYFHSFPLYFLPANCLAALLITPVVASGALFVALGALGFQWLWLTALTDRLCDLLYSVTDFFSSLPGASATSFYFEAWTVWPMLMSLVALKLMLDKRNGIRIPFFVSTCIVMVVTVLLSVPSAPEPRIYMLRNTYHTELAFADGDSVLRLVSTTPAEVNNVAGAAQTRFSEYLCRRGLRRVTVDTTRFQCDRSITLGASVIGLLSGKRYPLPPMKLTYAAVCRGFRGDMARLAEDYSPDTVLLAYDLHPRRAAIYMQQCDSLGLPYVWLRQRPWSVGYDPSCAKPLVK